MFHCPLYGLAEKVLVLKGSLLTKDDGKVCGSETLSLGIETLLSKCFYYPPKEIIVTQDLRDNIAFQLESVSSGMVFVHPTD